MSECLKKYISGLSPGCGVYLMLNENKDVLYVGKARDLKTRLKSYFNKGVSSKTKLLTQQVSEIDVQRTQTETEALLLESNLIKSLKPKFNILLRDDKSYPYLRISIGEKYPRLSIYRGKNNSGKQLFGPYADARTVRSMLHELQKIIPVRQCDDNTFKNRSRPCLQYQIKRCTAPCVGLISPDSYNEDVNELISLLKGKVDKLDLLYEDQMEKASQSLDFEKAAKYRDRISALRTLQEKQYITGRNHDADIVTLHKQGSDMVFSVMRIRNGQSLGSNHFSLKEKVDQSIRQLMESLIIQHYQNNEVPPEIITLTICNNTDILANTLEKLSGRKINIKTSVRGARSRWLTMANINALDYLKNTIDKQTAFNNKFDELLKVLELSYVPNRIDCVDVSHTQGCETLAAFVTVTRDGFLPDNYRKFNITNIKPGDDYDAIEQAIERRILLSNNDKALPIDILLIDGGKGQMERANRVFAYHAIKNVVLLSIAKGPSRKVGNEDIYRQDKSLLNISKGSAAHYFLCQVRDEAHRFAITGHRKKRIKTYKRSELHEIAGLGAKKRKALLSFFGGLKHVKLASIEDLKKVRGIGDNLACEIHNSLNSK